MKSWTFYFINIGIQESNLYFYKSPTCKSQVQNTSRISLVNIEYDV